MEYRCELLDRPSQPALVIRTRAPVESLPQVVGQAWGAIMEYAGQLGVWPSGAPFVAYMTDDDLWLADQPDAVRPHRVVQAILPLSLANHGPIGVDELSPVNNVVAG